MVKIHSSISLLNGLFRTGRFFCLFIVFLSVAESKTVRLLTIGNSFAENALTYLPQLAEASGNTLIYERANLGGCTLQRHWNHAEKFEANPNDPAGSPYSNGRYSLSQLLKKEPWDFITIQQVSWQSHDLETYYPYITNLYRYVRERAPQAHIMAHQIWAYRIDDPRFTPDNEGKEPHTHLVMYEQVRQAYHHLVNQFGLGILPSGDAMYRADIDPQWGFRPDTSFEAEKALYPALPDQTHSLHTGWFWRRQEDGNYQLRMDGHHAGDAGKYLLGCVWFEVLYDQIVVGNAFVPENLESGYVRFLQETAHRAVADLEVSN